MMIANADLYAIDESGADPLAAMGAEQIQEIMLRVSQIGGSEISGGPVPPNGTVGATTRAGRLLRRMGAGLSPENAANPQAMARYAGNINTASNIAAVTRRPNLLRLLHMVAHRARNAALARGEVDTDRERTRTIDQKAEMERRAALLAGAYATGRWIPEDVKVGLQKGMFSHWKTHKHVLGHVLADKMATGGGLLSTVNDTVRRATQPFRSLASRMFGRPDEPTMAVNGITGEGLTIDGIAAAPADAVDPTPAEPAPGTPVFTVATPEAPMPDSPAPVANTRPPTPMG
ncbi:MAG: hypothetical protein AAF556_11300 [Pseudomonadota bacterium]